MRVASRYMPRYIQKPIGLGNWVAIFILLALVIWGALEKPLLFIGAIITFSVLYVSARPQIKREEQQLLDLAASRSGESICEFAREFDRRNVDTWVVRAVYEQLQNHLKHVTPAFPLRSSDRLREDLFLDSDDLDLDLAQEIEFRTGRSLDVTSENPYRGKVKTVRDLVLFFQAQPRAENAT